MRGSRLNEDIYVIFIRRGVVAAALARRAVTEITSHRVHASPPRGGPWSAGDTCWALQDKRPLTPNTCQRFCRVPGVVFGARRSPQSL